VGDLMIVSRKPQQITDAPLSAPNCFKKGASPFTSVDSSRGKH